VDNLWDNLRANLWDNQIKIEFQNTYFWGQQDSYWIAFYQFCNEIGVSYNPSEIEKLNIWSEIAQSCMWWWPYEKLCIVCERPLEIHKDSLGRLHSDSRMAVSFRDGYGLYMWHGVNVPSWIIETPEKITPELIQSEKNSEIRRVMLQRFGFEKMLSSVGAKLINKHPNDLIGELWRWREPDGMEVQILKCKNGTPDPETGEDKWYCLLVPTRFTRAIDASRNSYPVFRHLSDEDYELTSHART
jgi:hypothetical protein